MNAAPSPNGADGRDERGRFAAGNAGGPGNPLGGKVAKLRAALLRSVTPAVLRRIVGALVSKAERGDTAAAKLVLAYTLGRPTEADLLERIEVLERVLADEP